MEIQNLDQNQFDFLAGRIKELLQLIANVETSIHQLSHRINELEDFQELTTDDIIKLDHQSNQLRLDIDREIDERIVDTEQLEMKVMSEIETLIESEHDDRITDTAELERDISNLQTEIQSFRTETKVDIEWINDELIRLEGY
jgi:predicted  nucleic acid-binding Zn-ribbon protein